MTKRKIVGAICLALATAGSYALYSSIQSTQREDAARLAQYESAQREHERTVGAVEKLAKEARTLEQWSEVRKHAFSLPLEAKKLFSLHADIATMEILADRRDRLLFNAGALFKANEKDPGIETNIAQAKELQERIKGFLKQIGDMADTPGAMARQYRDAYEKYRSLAFLQPQEADAALDIIDDAMHNLMRCNAIVPKDIRCEFAAELLYKRAKEEEKKRGSAPKIGPPRGLPTRPSIGDGPGTGGTERPHRH